MPGKPSTTRHRDARSSSQPLQLRRSRRLFVHSITPWLLMAPAVIMVLVALGYPLVRQTVMSFQEFGLAQQFGKPPRWVGFSNYITILTDHYFWIVFLKSVVFCFWTAGLTMLIGIAMSLLLLRVTSWVRSFINIALIIVWAMPVLALLTVWQWIVDPRSGLLNYILYLLGFKQFEGFNWLGGSFWTFYLIASATIIWQSLPLVTITIYAALAQLPTDVMEASAIDGATAGQQIRSIQLPMVFPVISLIGILQIIWDLRVFTQIYVFQQAGGIASETNLLGTYVYETGIQRGNYGIASALAMVILLLVLIMTFRYLQMLYRQGGVD